MRNLIILCLMISPSLTFSGENGGAGEKEKSAAQEYLNDISGAQNPCSRSETWRFSQPLSAEINARIGSESIQIFEQSLTGKIIPARSFGEALALRLRAQSSEAKIFAEYWMARAFFQQGMIEASFSALSAVARKTPETKNIGIQAAALGCLVGIRRVHPGYSISDATIHLPQLIRLSQSKQGVSAVLDQLRGVAFDRVLEGGKIQIFVELLAKSDDGISDAARGIYAIFEHDRGAALTSLKRAVERSKDLSILRPYEDTLRLLLGRELYTRGDYLGAVKAYEGVSRQSNQLVSMLTELAWSHYHAGNPGDAVGAAIALQSGAIKNTFSAESLMVMAIALNENCDYPEAIKAIHRFKRDYQDSWKWLKENGDRKDGYRMAIEFAKGRRTNIPKKIGLEWIRSPRFIANQDRINIVNSEPISAQRGLEEASKEQLRAARDLTASVRDLRKRWSLAKIRLKSDEQMPKTLIEEIQMLRRDLAHYRRLRAAAPTWKRALAYQGSLLAQVRARMVDGINKQISNENLKMQSIIEEVAENSELIEIEILGGAS
ncbi:MAG: hypothetical protein KGQ59_11705, partial [Bdellovibrionales bacterium]|nr:hypothetical protein [Bdellovibrionales bacterium]